MSTKIIKIIFNFYFSCRRKLFSGLKTVKPVPDGINLPIITFSFNPLNQSIFPSVAACVRIFVVSWKLAADKKLSVANDVRVIPNKIGLYVRIGCPSSFRAKLI